MGMINKPHEIHQKEWQEIMQLPIVIDSWGLTGEETVEEFASLVYGVKFYFESDSPGFVGTIYILHGGTLGIPPLILAMKEGLIQEVNQ